MNAMMKKKGLAALVIAVMVLLIGGAVHAEQLRVGVDTAFVPFEFKGKDGKWRTKETMLKEKKK